jgi:hypothetical protein
MLGRKAVKNAENRIQGHSNFATVLSVLSTPSTVNLKAMDTQHERWAAATRMLATHLISIVGVAVASQRSLAVSLVRNAVYPADRIDLPSRLFTTSTCFRYVHDARC